MSANILLYDWQSQSHDDLREALKKLSDVVVVDFSEQMMNYDDDPKFELALFEQIKIGECSICMSFDFFPVISKVCQRENVLYISWIYDSPHITLYSPCILNHCNVIFSFDLMQCHELKQMGVTNVFHLPLAVNVERIDRLRRMRRSNDDICKEFDLSFVGSLYEQNYYEQISYLPPHLKGYLDGICHAQRQLFGVDILSELLEENVIDELQEYVKLDMDPSYMISYEKMFCELFLKKYISSLERKEYLSSFGQYRRVTLFSKSDWIENGIDLHGTVDYRSEMPLIFAKSRLNFNMTIRSIISGIPLRCLDIMGAGSALLSNYQPELAEYFEPEKEWISFQSKQEMIEKAEFYLQHDDIREEIAQRGYEKVRKYFTYDKALKTMFEIVKKIMC